MPGTPQPVGARGGSLPSFAATQLRMRLSSRADRRRLIGLLIWQVVALAGAAGGVLLGRRLVAGAGLMALALGMVAVVALLPRPGRRQLAWAGPRIVHLITGWAWWTGGLAVAAVAALRGDDILPVPLVVLVAVCGLGQLLAGSLAYLLPVLRGGGPEQLGEGFRVMRSWPAVVAANLVGVAAVAGWVPVAVTLAALWLADVVSRVARLTVGSDVRSGSPAATGAAAGRVRGGAGAGKAGRSSP